MSEPDSFALQTIVADDEHTEERSDHDEDALILPPVETSKPDYRKKYYCGLGSCHPKWLQLFASKKFFSFLLFSFAFLEGSVVSGFTSVVLSTLETRYEFSTSAVGFVAVSYDTVAIFTAIVVSYLGGRPNSNKPKWLGFSLMVMGIGSFIFASPQFLFGKYRAGPSQNNSLEQCHDNRNMTAVCTPANDIAYAVYIFGNVFVAAGAASLYTVGPAFIDEIVYPKYVPLHIGVYQLGTLLGPAFGFGMGSACLLIYVDPWERTSLKPTDPSWVGGWWIAFVFTGIMSFLLSIPFLMYPKQLPDSHLVRLAREKEMTMRYNDSRTSKANIIERLRMFLVQVKRLVFNLPFMFQSFSLAILFIVVTGMTSFGAKYIQYQFHFTAAASGLTAGAVAITAASTGVMLGAVVLHLTKLKGRKLAAFITIIIMILILATPALLLNCSTVKLAGITTPYANGSQSGVDSSFCASVCDCGSSVYEPVCGADGITYFSPCRAGCTVNLLENNMFSNCSCVAESLYFFKNSSVHYDIILANNSTATGDVCETSCPLTLTVFIAAVLVTFFFAFLAHIPVIYFTMRVVADDQRSFALGLQSSIFRVFGSIPGPLLFGAIFDSVCIKWEDVCGRNGNCWVYDNMGLSREAFYLTLPCVFVSAVLSFLAWVFYPSDKGSFHYSKTLKADVNDHSSDSD